MPVLFAITLLLQGVAETPADTGKIILYRPSSIVGAAVGCPIRHEGRELVELGRGKYAEWNVAPGRYLLINKTSSIEVTVAAGETRYVRCVIKAGFMSGRADLQMSDETSYSDKASSYERREIGP